MAYVIDHGKPISLNGEVVIGRTQQATIPVADTDASRQHARLWQQDDAWWIEDLHSAHGTAVNERKLITGPARLRDGDRIRICATVFEFHEGEPQVDLASDTPKHLANGTKVGSYDIIAHLGDGVATSIYKAHINGNHVALHMVDPALVAEDDSFAKRFLRDIEMAANVRHPHAVCIHRAGGFERTAWYSTNLITGQNLAHHLGTPFHPLVAIDIAISLCSALLPYSQCGLVHGDLKPRSLGIVNKQTVRVMDLGLIGLNAEERLRAQARGMTRQVYYLCPNQAKGGDCNTRSDLYGIGCILVHMLTGRPPFLGADFAAVMHAHEHEPIPELAAQLKLPKLLDDIITGLLHKDPFFRFENTELASARLQELCTQLSS